MMMVVMVDMMVYSITYVFADTQIRREAEGGAHPTWQQPALHIFGFKTALSLRVTSLKLCPFFILSLDHTYWLDRTGQNDVSGAHKLT